MKSRQKQVFNEINITPLTDIFLVLLIIMMVVAPMLDTSGLKLSVPSVGPSADTKDEPKVLTIRLDAQGSYSIDGKPVDILFLSNTIRNTKAEKPDGLVIETDPKASHESLTRVIDAAQTAGVTKIAVKETAPAA
jgi:biopolymer transport protein ExbD/biopolymer transport protein TolR